MLAGISSAHRTIASVSCFCKPEGSKSNGAGLLLVVLAPLSTNFLFGIADSSNRTSFDFADSDEAVIRFAQDDNLVGRGSWRKQAEGSRQWKGVLLVDGFAINSAFDLEGAVDAGTKVPAYLKDKIYVQVRM